MSGQSKDELTVANATEETVKQENGNLIDVHSKVDENRYPGPFKLSFILISLSLAVFLYGLDQTIIATAIPKITDEFHALGEVGWYAAAYLLTSSAFQLVFGKMFTIFSVKYVYLAAVLIFELGSLICASAPNSVAFIIGRAIAGIGAAGVYSGSIIVLANSAPLEKRPMYTGILGAAVGVASIVGPFLGGTFADKVTWRWCFYINLPLGAVTLVIVFLFVHIPQDPRYAAMSWIQLVKQLDIPGIITLIPAIISLLLALQWGGSTYAWRNARIIVLFILFAILAIAFIAVQKYTPNTRTIPRSIFRSRSIGFTTWYTGCTFSLFVIMVYYLPIWFQGIEQVTAFESGIRTVPLIIGFIVFAVIAGILTSVIGYYTPMMIVSSIIMPIAVGLMTTFKPNTSSSKWIGYQAFFGFGVGFGIQQPLLVIQTVLPDADVPVGTALITLTQALFAAVFIAVAQNIFENRLSKNIHAILPNFDIQMLLNGGATTAIRSVPLASQGPFLDAYSKSITQTFYLPVALAALSLIGSLGTEWGSVKNGNKEKLNANTEERVFKENKIEEGNVVAKSNKS